MERTTLQQLNSKAQEIASLGYFTFEIERGSKTNGISWAVTFSEKHGKRNAKIRAATASELWAKMDAAATLLHLTWVPAQ